MLAIEDGGAESSGSDGGESDDVGFVSETSSDASENVDDDGDVSDQGEAARDDDDDVDGKPPPPFDEDAVDECAEEAAHVDNLSDGLEDLDIEPAAGDEHRPDDIEEASGEQHATSGSASSSGVLVPHIPSAIVVPIMPAALEAIHRDVVLYLPGGTGGKIAFYVKGQIFEVTCTNPKHGRCRFTRTVKPPRGKNLFSNPFQGRSLGLVAAWAFNNDQCSAQEHLAFRPSLQQRQDARPKLSELSPTVAHDLARGERAREANEPLEPDFID
jgi:hypothetical protein